jgi:hypothetical protein
MEYIDPLPVTCPGCAKTGSYRVADLLALRATCTFCSQNLQSVGREMRSAFAENSAFFGMAEVAVAVERELGVGISDSLLETCAAPRDLVLKLAEGSAEVPLPDIEAVVCRKLAHLLERDVTSVDLTMSWKSLFGRS